MFRKPTGLGISVVGGLTEFESKQYLVAPVSNATIDALAAFEAEGEDREPGDLCDEPGFDNEPDHDNEPSIC